MNSTIIRPPRKIFSVIIHKRSYDVFDVEGKEHGGYNDIPKTWWLYFSDPLPPGALPPIDSESWEPYHRSIERRLWDIRFTQRNTTKEKWGETQFRSHTSCEMYCNEKLIYEFSTIGGDGGMSFAMAKVQYFQTMLSEHPFNFFNPEEENGRKIFWKGLPATIRTRSNSWEISIIPDYTTGLSKDEWWKELERRESKISKLPDPDWDSIEKQDSEEDRRNESINWGDAFSDGYIDWFRKTDKPE